MPDKEATTHADLYHRHGDPDSSKWEEAPAVTDRPNDTPLREKEKPAVANSTLAERAKARQAAETKQVDAESETEDKAVTSASTKRTRK